MNDITISKELDTSGLNCPQPLMQARSELSKMQKNEILHIISTDSACFKDFTAFCAHTGHNIVKQYEEDGKFHILVECG